MRPGELYAVVEWIPAAMRFQFAHGTFSLVRLFPYRAFLGGKAYLVVFPGRIFISFVFSDLLMTPAPLCDNGL